MKVTDKQFLELASAFNRIDLIGLPYVRGAVEAALDDVPEPLLVPEYVPGSGGLSGPEACRMSVGYERSRRRIAELEEQAQQTADVVVALQRKAEELEAKLEKVRAYLSESPTVLRGQLLDILDGKEPP